ncbi:hypothetical protein D3C81_1924740 [compost metagenome]
MPVQRRKHFQHVVIARRADFRHRADKAVAVALVRFVSRDKLKPLAPGIQLRQRPAGRIRAGAVDTVNQKRLTPLRA